MYCEKTIYALFISGVLRVQFNNHGANQRGAFTGQSNRRKEPAAGVCDGIFGERREQGVR